MAASSLVLAQRSLPQVEERLPWSGPKYGVAASKKPTQPEDLGCRKMLIKKRQQ